MVVAAHGPSCFQNGSNSAALSPNLALQAPDNLMAVSGLGREVRPGSFGVDGFPRFLSPVTSKGWFCCEKAVCLPAGCGPDLQPELQHGRLRWKQEQLRLQDG